MLPYLEKRCLKMSLSSGPEMRALWIIGAGLEPNSVLRRDTQMEEVGAM